MYIDRESEGFSAFYTIKVWNSLTEDSCTCLPYTYALTKYLKTIVSDSKCAKVWDAFVHSAFLVHLP